MYSLRFPHKLQIYVFESGTEPGEGLNIPSCLNDRTHDGLIILIIGFVLVAELFNTAIERLGDEAANGVQKQLIKRAKDIAAAGVLLSALTALILGILFLVIPFIQSFR
jgi:diacylglycerol kinase